MNSKCREIYLNWMPGYIPCLVSDTFVGSHNLSVDFTRRHANLFIHNDRKTFVS